MYNLVFCKMPLHFWFCISLEKYVSLSDRQGHQRYIFQLYLFILQLLSLELCTQVKLATAMYNKTSNQEIVDTFSFCLSPQINFFKETLAAISILSLQRQQAFLFH